MTDDGLAMKVTSVDADMHHCPRADGAPEPLYQLVVVCRGLRCSFAGLLWCGLLRVVGLRGP